MNGELIPRPFQASRVLADDYEMYEALTTFASMMVEDTSCLLSKSSTSIDLSFLFKADEYIKQIQKQRDLSIESRRVKYMSSRLELATDESFEFHRQWQMHRLIAQTIVKRLIFLLFLFFYIYLL